MEERLTCEVKNIGHLVIIAAIFQAIQNSAPPPVTAYNPTAYPVS